jgi:hypothetical protein
MATIRGVNLEDHIVTSGTKKFLVQLSDVYGSLGGLCGVAKLAAGAPIPADAVATTVSEALRSGQLIRVRVSYKRAGEARTRSSQIVVAPAKVDEVFAAARGKSLMTGSKIVGVGFKRRRRLS